MFSTRPVDITTLTYMWSSSSMKTTLETTACCQGKMLWSYSSITPENDYLIWKTNKTCKPPPNLTLENKKQFAQFNGFCLGQCYTPPRHVVTCLVKSNSFQMTLLYWSPRPERAGLQSRSWIICQLLSCKLVNIECWEDERARYWSQREEGGGGGGGLPSDS